MSKIKLNNGHVILYSGVDLKKRAAAGMSCSIHKDLVQCIHNKQKLLALLWHMGQMKTIIKITRINFGMI